MPSGFVSILFWDSRYGAAKLPIPQGTLLNMQKHSQQENWLVHIQCAVKQHGIYKSAEFNF